MNELCNCRVEYRSQIIYCNKLKNHTGSHESNHTNKLDIKINISWKLNALKDILITLEFLKDNTDFYKILDKYEDDNKCKFEVEYDYIEYQSQPSIFLRMICCYNKYKLEPMDELFKHIEEKYSVDFRYNIMF